MALAPEKLTLNKHQTQDMENENGSATTHEVLVEDDAENDDVVVPQHYSITSFGADYDVEGLVKRLERGDIFIPSFQRGYVWPLTTASRFIESLLLGLPVPGVFLARESDNRLIVIDGQQRLKTLEFFYKGVFNPKPVEKTHRVFKLTKVQEQFEGCTYETLEEQFKVRLNDSIIHATVVRQESPDDDNTSIYHIFERLNTGSQRLAPQELRTAIYHGPFIDTIKELNDGSRWRRIFGKTHPRLKDQELILRFFAMYFEGENYQRPMEEFLSRFAGKHRTPKPQFLAEVRTLFTDTIDIAEQRLDDKVFRPEKAFNAAVFDSVMVGLARRMAINPAIKSATVQEAYNRLISDEVYLDAVSQATADESRVRVRMSMATEAFAKV